MNRNVRSRQPGVAAGLLVTRVSSGKKQSSGQAICIGLTIEGLDLFSNGMKEGFMSFWQDNSELRIFHKFV